MSALLQHSFPETRSWRSGAVLRSACHAAAHQSDAQRPMIPHQRRNQLAQYAFWLLVPQPWAWGCLHRLVNPHTRVGLSFLFFFTAVFCLFGAFLRSCKGSGSVGDMTSSKDAQHVCGFGYVGLISHSFQLQALQYVNFRGWDHICGFMEIKF